MKINKTYIKVGTYENKEYNENGEEKVISTLENAILGAICQFTETPISGKVFKIGKNFVEKDYSYEDENGSIINVKNDFDTALETDIDINEIEIGKSTYINGVFTSNKES